MSRPKGVCVYTNGFPIQKLLLNKFRGRLLTTTVRPRPEMQVVVISVHVDTTGKVFKTAKDAARQILRALVTAAVQSQRHSRGRPESHGTLERRRRAGAR